MNSNSRSSKGAGGHRKPESDGFIFIGSCRFLQWATIRPSYTARADMSL